MATTRQTLRRATRLLCLIALCGSARAATPPNDNFANAVAIPFQQGTILGSNLGATREPGEPNHADNPGGASVWWKITLPESGYLTLSTLRSVSTNGDGLDTLLAVYIGTNLTNLVLIGANDEDDESGEHGSKVLLRATASVEYRISVDGYRWGNFGPDQGRIVLDVSFSKTITYPPAPAWELPDIEGRIVKSSDFTNQVVLLNFWATWCPPCVAEIPDLVRLQETYRDLGLAVVGISVDDPENNALPIDLVGAFARDHAMNYPIVMTRPGGEWVEDAYDGIRYIPTSVIIDRRNHIVRRTAFAHTFAEFQSYVLPYLLDSVELRVRSADGRITLEWPTIPAQIQIQVQYSDQLPAASWKPVVGTPVAGVETTSLSLDDPDASAPDKTRFYRLQFVP